MAMLPDSHYMWMYVSVASFGKAKVTLEDEIGKISLENGDTIDVKDFQIDNDHRCYTFVMDYKTGRKKSMLKIKETIDRQMLITYIVYDCLYCSIYFTYDF